MPLFYKQDMYKEDNYLYQVGTSVNTFYPSSCLINCRDLEQNKNGEKKGGGPIFDTENLKQARINHFI